MSVKLEPGEILGSRYRLVRPLGEGGMGVVWEAVELDGGRAVAVKVLKLRFAGRGDFGARLLREARSAGAVQHPDVVEIVDAFEADTDVPVIVMELLRGETLRQRLDRSGPLALPQAAQIFARVAVAVAAAHARGIVHRDLKPENVFLLADDAVKVLDFGIAKHLEPEADASGLVGATTAGVVLGTPLYMAPEQAFGEPDVDQRADVWAIGVMLFEAFAGFRPIESTSRARILKALASRPLPSLSEAAPHAPEELVELVDAMLQRQPEDRPGNLTSVAQVLERLASSPGGAAGGGTSGLATCGGRAARTAASSAMTRAATATAGRRWGIGGAVTLAALALGVAVGRDRVAKPLGDEAPAATPAPLLASATTVLACPLLEAAGTEEPSGWLGAAAAHLACQGALTMRGGFEDSVLFPAELLDAPPQPSDDFPVDLYDRPDARERALRAAERATAFFDGRVLVEADGFLVELVLRRSNDSTEVARASGKGKYLREAVRGALDDLVRARALPRAPELAPGPAGWSGLHDIDLALQYEVYEDDEPTSRELCEGYLARRATYDRLDWMAALTICAETLRDIELPQFEIDRTTVGSFVATALYDRARAPDQSRRLAEEMRERSASEPTRFARGQLALAEGVLWHRLGMPSEATTALLSALRENPHDGDTWRALARIVPTTKTLGAATIWAPAQADTYGRLSAETELPFPRRIQLAERHYVLRRSTDAACVTLGRMLALAGRDERLRVLAAACSVDVAPIVGEYLLARMDLNAGRFGAALGRLRAALPVPPLAVRSSAEIYSLILAATVAHLLGRERETADAWTERFLESESGVDTFNAVGVAVMCMYARPDLAARCFDRIPEEAFVYTGTREKVAGARAYAKGDKRAAALAWRPLASQQAALPGEIPVEVFDEAGQPELARKLDAAIMTAMPNLRGISVAHPREALRAAKRGDTKTAVALARQVLDAWAAVDVEVPVLAELRKLLERSDRGGRAPR